MRLQQSKGLQGWSTPVIGMLASLALIPLMVQGQILCQQFGPDSFHVNSTIKFLWTDAGAEPISAFNLDFYCYENNQLIKTLASLNTSSSSSPQYWTVDQSIMNTISECPMNQYQGRFDWTYTDPNTGSLTNGTAPCKSILLVGPGVTPPAGALPIEPQIVDDNPGPVEITNQTKMIVIGVGCAVGVLVLAGVAAFYFIRYKNKRAEDNVAGEKLQELLSRPSAEDDGFDGNQNNTTVIANTSGYAIVPKTEMSEMSCPRPYPNSRPQSFVTSSPNANRQGPFADGKPPSLLTSPFTPPEESTRVMLEREQQRQQYEQQMIHQQQLQNHHQQQQQDQTQLNYGGY
ncbi:hypothetical protein BGZ49_005878 [Haplosporangium sp. Z 27]|nr:hypothetical protein BGZ49_005878 [Haplosporangium sp. Z 27]